MNGQILNAILVSYINKIRDTAIELGSRDPFRTWNLAQSNNGSLVK